MIYKDTPAEFDPKFEVVSCYVEHGGEILLLHRQDHKTEGGKWGVPAGKVDAGETRDQAMLREIQEETGLVLGEDELDYLRMIEVHHGDYDFIYHMYRTTLDTAPSIITRPEEHVAHVWKTPASALTELDLVTDLDECIKMYY